MARWLIACACVTLLGVVSTAARPEQNSVSPGSGHSPPSSPSWTFDEECGTEVPSHETVVKWAKVMDAGKAFMKGEIDKQALLAAVGPELGHPSDSTALAMLRFNNLRGRSQHQTTPPWLTELLQRFEESSTLENVPMKVFFHVATTQSGVCRDRVVTEESQFCGRSLQGMTTSAQMDKAIVSLNHYFKIGDVQLFKFVKSSADWIASDQFHNADFVGDDMRRWMARVQVDADTGLNVYINNQSDAFAGSARPHWDSILGRDRGFTKETDSICMHHEAFPGLPVLPLRRAYNGMTIVHEVGHWFGLLHTHQDECTMPNDGCADTPAMAQPENLLNCHDPHLDIDTCPDLPGNDPIHNIMSYVWDDCRTHFTQDQLLIMRLHLVYYRTTLLP